MSVISPQFLNPSAKNWEKQNKAKQPENYLEDCLEKSFQNVKGAENYFKALQSKIDK